MENRRESHLGRRLVFATCHPQRACLRYMSPTKGLSPLHATHKGLVSATCHPQRACLRYMPPTKGLSPLHATHKGLVFATCHPQRACLRYMPLTKTRGSKCVYNETTHIAKTTNKQCPPTTSTVSTNNTQPLYNSSIGISQRRQF